MIFALLASVGYLGTIFLLHQPDKFSKGRLLACMSTAFVAHLAQVITGLQGIMNDVSVMNMLTLVAFCMTCLGAIRYFNYQEKMAYTVVAYIASACVWFPVFIQTQGTQIHSWSLKFHIVLSIAAYIALGFGALYATFLLLQDKRLRQGKSVFNLELPLNYIEKTMLSFTIAGELLLTLSLATGLLFIHDIWAQHISHKVVFGAISWLIIAILLFRHYRQGFRGRKAAIWLLSGFMFLILAYFGSALVLQLILH